jgi:Bacterial Ig-like domain (group 1)
LQLFATPASIPVDGTSIITVGVFDLNGRPVPDVGLNWQSTLGALDGTAGNTDANGRKTATLRGTGVAGTAIITVIIATSGEQADTPVRIGLD